MAQKMFAFHIYWKCANPSGTDDVITLHESDPMFRSPVLAAQCARKFIPYAATLNSVPVNQLFYTVTYEQVC